MKVDKETKEAAEKYAFYRQFTDANGNVVTDYESDKLEGFMAGAKWMQKRLMKTMPKWKKVCPDVGQTILYKDGTYSRLQRFGYEIDLKELDKLPKED